MQKVACVFSFKMSNWVSCQKIVFNLHKAYQLHPDLELLNFNYSSDQSATELMDTVQKLRAAEPDTIVVMDHKPHPIELFQLLLPHYKDEKKKPRIIIHVFGDFTLYYASWDKLAKLLIGHEVDFIVASERQKDLIDKFLIPPMSSHVCPFPVDKKEFNYLPPLRKMQRKDWGLQEDDMAYVFTGRLSRQKRIHTLLKSFSEFVVSSKSSRSHLFLYGTTDNIGDQFVGKWETEGEYFRKIYRIYQELPAKVQEKVHFMGVVPNAELKTVYQGADYLVNLSVHNDEDFGMSVAEAQCSGLPAILTDWGGLASFRHPQLSQATLFIPVKIGKKNKLILYPKILESFQASLKSKGMKREELSKSALSRFSVEAAHRALQDILKQRPKIFQGFSPLMEEVLHKISFTHTPYLKENKEINNLYRKIYSSYVRHP